MGVEEMKKIQHGCVKFCHVMYMFHRNVTNRNNYALREYHWISHHEKSVYMNGTGSENQIFPKLVHKLRAKHHDTRKDLHLSV